MAKNVRVSLYGVEVTVMDLATAVRVNRTRIRQRLKSAPSLEEVKRLENIKAGEHIEFAKGTSYTLVGA